MSVIVPSDETSLPSTSLNVSQYCNQIWKIGQCGIVYLFEGGIYKGTCIICIVYKLTWKTRTLEGVHIILVKYKMYLGLIFPKFGNTNYYFTGGLVIESCCGCY